MKLYAVILNPESLGVSDWSTQGRSNCENLVLFVVHDCVVLVHFTIVEPMENMYE